MNSGTGYRSHWYLQHFRVEPLAVIQKVSTIQQKLCSGTGSACPTHLHFEYCWHKLSESEVFTTLLSHNWRSFGVTLGGRSKNPRGSRGARGSNRKTPGGLVGEAVRCRGASMCIGEGGEGRSAVPEEDSMNTHGSNSCVTEVF